MSGKSIFVRLDKIGDLVATLPVDQADFLQSKDILWIVDQGVGFLPPLAEPARNFKTLNLKKAWDSFWRFKKFLVTEKPERVLIFYGPWWISLAAWLAKVPLRIGRLSQWHSFLFLNKVLRQSRSLSEKHEADYNWELVHFAFQRPKPSTPAPFMRVQSGLKRHLFEKFDLRSRSYVVVHPGMAGSALNWPQASYNQLIEVLVETTTVVITGTKTDEPWLTEIAPRWKNHPRVRYLVQQLAIEDLIFILQSAQAVVAPSTGVLHLAAATGVPVIGIYSPVKAHHPKRWGPRGYGVQTLLPDVTCPATITCLKEKCPHHPCMTKITVEQVVNKVFGKAL